MKKLFLLIAILLLFPAPSAYAQETPIDPQSTEIQQAKGASFKQGWNYFTLGFSDCTVENVLNELQADGGSALKAETLYLKELFSWKPYSFLNTEARKKKIDGTQLIAFSSNQNFFLEMDQKICLYPDSERQEQIDVVRQGISEKSSLVEKVRDLPNDLWTKLVDLLNNPSSSSTLDTPSEDRILEDLTIGGKTVVKDLGITGKISSGLLAIEGLSDSETATINTLSNDLYLQNQGLGGINILGGLVAIDKKGNLKAQKINIDTSNQGTSAVGRGVVPAGQTSATILTTAVTSESMVFVTLETVNDFPLAVTNKVSGQSFRVEISKSAGKDLKFNWWIVN